MDVAERTNGGRLFETYDAWDEGAIIVLVLGYAAKITSTEVKAPACAPMPLSADVID